jgi:DHA2 family multidrug resistance protein
MAMYGGILTFLPIQFRLQRYFTLRTYLLCALALGILLNLGSFATRDIIVFFVLRFFQGAVVAASVGAMLIQIFSILPKEKAGIVGSSVLFTGILGSAAVIGTLSSWVAANMDWNFTYYGLIALQALAMVVCYFLFHPAMKQRPYPLYQLDWAGAVFFACFSLSLAYLFIYGPKRYWFSDPGMVRAGLFCLVMLGLFLYRQAVLKRALIDLRVFRYSKFILGLVLLLLFYGMKDTVNLIYGYAGGILGWSTADVVRLALCNCAGVVASIGIAAALVLKSKSNVPKLLLAGFLFMVCYNLWMYRFLTPNLSFAELAGPVFVQGLASGLIFLPVMLLTMSAVPAFTGMTGIIVCAYARFIAALNSLSGFYTLQLSYNQEYKEGFLGYLSPQDQNFTARSAQYQSLFLSKGYTGEQAYTVSNGLISKAAALQSQLLTNRTLFLFGALLMGAAIAIMAVFMVTSKIKASRAAGNPLG